MNEASIQQFWQAHPCGDALVGGLGQKHQGDLEQFFAAYDSWRYRQEGHIPGCLDTIEWAGRDVLEIGLGQGAESEQLIRRGARWSGLDLTEEAVRRVAARLALRDLPYRQIQQGSVLSIPWPDDSFDVVFSHGVLHHVPEITTAAAEIRRVLRPDGLLVAMLYARRSLNFQVSIRLVRRAVLAAAYPLRRVPAVGRSTIVGQHLDNAEAVGLRNYLCLENFTHRNTDGPLNPFARVYSLPEVRRDFPGFRRVRSSQHYMHAPPLPVHGLPGASRLGWHLWLVLQSERAP
ncbi:MAG TPA: class I SAM-dependent methyltransferase [Sporichthyaceae bacterium]|nr:class I SAM-dependent methyltransferase [Sporichthyaceae bacterium]